MKPVWRALHIYKSAGDDGCTEFIFGRLFRVLTFQEDKFSFAIISRHFQLDWNVWRDNKFTFYYDPIFKKAKRCPNSE